MQGRSSTLACSVFHGGMPRAARAPRLVIVLIAFLLLAGTARGDTPAQRPGGGKQAAPALPSAGIPGPPAGHVAEMAAWIAKSKDNSGAPFLIVDKRNAALFVYDAEARRVATSPVLLGAAQGDDSVPGIGERKLADIKPYERTTPAGRFVAEAGRNLQGEDIVWIDYDAAVSMHRVRATNPKERRLERLATPSAADNRISYGCINVPARFFDAYVSPIFAGGREAVVYVLPDTKPLATVFPDAGRAGAQ